MGGWSFPVTASFPSNVSLTHCASALGEGMTQETASLSLPVSTEQAEPLSVTQFHILHMFNRSSYTQSAWKTSLADFISCSVDPETLRIQYKFTPCQGLPFHSLCWSPFQPVEYTMMVYSIVRWLIGFREPPPLTPFQHRIGAGAVSDYFCNFPKVNIQHSHSFQTVIGQICGNENKAWVKTLWL